METHSLPRDPMRNFKPAAVLNSKGALRLALALLEHSISLIKVTKITTRQDIIDQFKARRNFIQNHPIVAATIDVMEYDPVRFKNKMLDILDERQKRAFSTLTQYRQAPEVRTVIQKIELTMLNQNRLAKERAYGKRGRPPKRFYRRFL